MVSYLHALRHYLLDRMVLRPTRNRVDPDAQQRIWLTSAGRRLECFVHAVAPGDGPLDCLVLKFPGTQGRAERSTSDPLPLLPVGLRGEVWTWNPPGYGRSSGRATLQRVADASLDFCRQAIEQRSSDSTKIWLCGNSLGAVTALNVATRMPLPPNRAAMILRNPPPLIPVVQRVVRTYPLGRLADGIAESLIASMDATVTAPSVTLPAVFLQSTCDTLVPPSLQRQIHEAYGGEKKIVSLAGLEHHDAPDESHEPARREAIQWLWQRMA